MLKNIVFDNFKSFEGKVTLSIEKWTTLIGLNSSGKSNAIEGIILIAKIASGESLSSIFGELSDEVGSIRGGFKGCCRDKQRFGLGCDIQCEDGLLEYRVSVESSGDNRILIQEESLHLMIDNEATLLFHAKKSPQHKSDIKVIFNNGLKGRNPMVFVDRSKSVLSQLTKEWIELNSLKSVLDEQQYTKFDAEEFLNVMKQVKSAFIIPYIEKIQYAMQNVRLFKPQPSQMRGYVRQEDNAFLATNGSNLSAILNKFQRSPEKSQIFSDLINIVQEVPNSSVSDISVEMTSLKDVMFVCKEERYEKSKNIPASLLSDGTLSVIALATLLLDSPRGSVILIDEFDMTIHHSRVFRFVQKLSELATKKQLTIVVTTHNTLLLDHYTQDYLQGVSVVYRSNNGFSDIRAFVDIQHYEKIIATGGLGTNASIDGLESYLNDTVNQVDLPTWLMGGA